MVRAKIRSYRDSVYPGVKMEWNFVSKIMQDVLKDHRTSDEEKARLAALRVECIKNLRAKKKKAKEEEKKKQQQQQEEEQQRKRKSLPATAASSSGGGGDKKVTILVLGAHPPVLLSSSFQTTH